MEITEVKLTTVKGDEKLKAFVSITIDNAFVVRDLKIIKGKRGEFVAMPSRKLTEHCTKCGRKNNVYSAYCSSCGEKQPRSAGEEKHKKIYADIAHPINAECRMMIQNKVLEAYRKMTEKESETVEESVVEDAGPLDIGDEVSEQESREEETDKEDDFSEGIW